MPSELIVVDVLPPEVHDKVSTLRALDGAAQVMQVTAMLSHARTGLLAAIAAQDLPQIVEYKAKGAAVQEIAKQLRLGKDMQQDASEFCRRAERGLGVAIREGQERGEIQTRGDNLHTLRDIQNTSYKSSPSDYASKGELAGQHNSGGIYAMTDGVSDETFEQALAEAREEENLARANVARKCKKKSDVSAPIPINRKTGPQRQKARAEARQTWISSAITLQSISTQMSRISIKDLEVHEHDTELLQAFRVVGDAIKVITKLQKEIRNEHNVEGT